MGGIQSSLGKRTRHRRALMRMLFEYHDSDRLVVCMDPSNLDLMHDFFSDRSLTRLLQIECEFTDNYLSGHARRVGLAGERTTQATLDRLLPTIRNDITYEADRIRDAGFNRHSRIRQSDSAETNASKLMEFFSVSHDKALQLAQTRHLFED